MSQDELNALADCVAILLDDIRQWQQKTRSAVILADAADRAGDSGTQIAPAGSESIPHDHE